MHVVCNELPQKPRVSARLRLDDVIRRGKRTRMNAHVRELGRVYMNRVACACFWV